MLITITYSITDISNVITIITSVVIVSYIMTQLVHSHL